ncbi:hypothetical protein K227x_53410 [Rubripirellula lacrimiformis]|uniref:Uncharacterized protein n=1 Tax=Rubripirellula lacrimiformis TaxID=1930273 RepID=A0A517NIF5_9BACT|nr:hypothetical protein K227x_53410 [Rubripirellula lacrimiformis]
MKFAMRLGGFLCFGFALTYFSFAESPRNRGALCANMRETTLNFIRVEGMEHSHDRYRQQKN